jgi:hypothetical protein
VLFGVLGAGPLGERVLQDPAEAGLKVGGGLPLLYNSAYFLQSIFRRFAFFEANFVF